VTAVTEALDVSLAELDFEAAIPCACKSFCSPRDHAATWWITVTCGCCYPFCQTALRMANLRLKVRPLDCRLCGTGRIAVRSVVRI